MELKVNSDEAMALRAQRFRKIDALVRDAVPLEEEVPAELLARLGLQAPRVGADNVVNMAEARAAKAAAQAPAARGSWRGLAQGRLAAQWLLLLGLGIGGTLYFAAPRPSEPQAEYHVLGDAPQPGVSSLQPNAVAMFAPGTDQHRIRALLAGSGAKVIGAPSAQGLWKLSTPAGQRKAILEKLAADPAVTMAEPLDTGDGQ